MLKKLKHYGGKGIPLQGFESYSSNRKQYVSINGSTSDELILFINDLPNVSEFLSFYLFADTNIYYESSDLLNIQRVVNGELRKVRKWLEANK